LKLKLRDRVKLAVKALSFGSDEWMEYLRGHVGYESSSGMPVTAETAMRISTVNACVRIIAETCASLPLQVYKRLDNGGKELCRNHPLYNLLYMRPNPWQTSFDWRAQMYTHLLLRGNYYGIILDHGDGIVDDIIPLNPDGVSVEQLPDYSLLYHVTTNRGELLTLSQEKILHIRGLSSDGVLGRSVIGDARDSFGAALATQEFTGKYWANGATPGAVLKFNGKIASKADADRIRDLWNDDHAGPSNANKIHILSEGSSFEKIDVSAEDAQFIETRRFQKADIAGLFRVPMFLLQSDSSTATYASSEQFMLSFVTHCIRPWLVNVEQALHNQLFTVPAYYFPEHNLDAIMRGDLSSRYTAYKTARDGGWLSKNEIRAKENMNPISGGDDYRSLTELQNAKQLEGGNT